MQRSDNAVYQSVFKRYELKYMLTQQQKSRVLQLASEFMELDKYGRTTIRNVYFDTDDFRLIRHSLEKPVYKEKMRIRSYDLADADSNVFVELKKKYEDVVYKRRVAMPELEAVRWIEQGIHCRKRTQITDEIDYFLSFYENLHPVVFLSYEREAYFCKDGSDFRITFDDTILSRTDRLSLEEKVGGYPLLENGYTLMEIKCSGGIPLWMTEILSKERIFKTSFSKYGTAFQKLIFSKLFRRV